MSSQSSRDKNSIYTSSFWFCYSEFFLSWHIWWNKSRSHDRFRCCKWNICLWITYVSRMKEFCCSSNLSRNKWSKYFRERKKSVSFSTRNNISATTWSTIILRSWFKTTWLIDKCQNYLWKYSEKARRVFSK